MGTAGHLVWVSVLGGCLMEPPTSDLDPEPATSSTESEISGGNLGGTNLGGANLGGVNLGGSNLGGSNVAGANIGMGTPIAGTRLASATFATSGVGNNIHALAAASGMLNSGEDLWTRTSSCVVMGLGSRTVAELIRENTGATMYAALDPLPWGFASTKGGAIQLQAWEALIWGSDRYCSFVIVAPVATSWPGAAGFVKAIFRWQAPSTKTIKIGHFGGDTAPISYTGMMNVGAKVLAGTVSDKAFLAGELAFVSATTNNQTVNVDFASWVDDVNNAGLLLGDVDGTPQFYEGAYLAYEAPDGIHVGVWKPLFGGGGFNEHSALTLLNAQYTGYTNGIGNRPVPKRCAGAMSLNDSTLMAAKCDSALTLEGIGGTGSLGGVDGGAVWASPSGFTWLKIERGDDAGALSMRFCTQGGYGCDGTFSCDTTQPFYPILSMTYIHLNESAWSRPDNAYVLPLVVAMPPITHNMTGTYTVTVQNLGDTSVSGWKVSAVASSGTPKAATVTTSPITLPTIGPNGKATATFTIMAGSKAAQGTIDVNVTTATGQRLQYQGVGFRVI